MSEFDPEVDVPVGEGDVDVPAPVEEARFFSIVLNDEVVATGVVYSGVTTITWVETEKTVSWPLASPEFLFPEGSDTSVVWS